MRTVGRNREAWWSWDVAVGDQKTDQDRDMDKAGLARTILEALDDQSL
jgi:hypothetical protein